MFAATVYMITFSHFALSIYILLTCWLCPHFSQ